MLKSQTYSKVHIEISNICNLQCTFCPEVIRPKKVMDEALFRRIIEQLAPLTDQVAFHLMGDPLVNPKLATFVAICQEHHVKINLVTNGVLLRDKTADLLLNPAFRQVNFSLHSYPNNFPDRDPTAYLDRIFAFCDKAFVEREDLYINFRLWNLATPQGVESKNIQMLERIEQRFGCHIRKDIDVRRFKSQRLIHRLYLHFDTEFTWPSMELPVLGETGRCYGLSQHFGILVDGTIVPCCLDKEGVIPLGNINDQPLEAILAGPKAKAMLDGFNRGKLVEDLCKRCQYITRFSR